MSDIRIPLNARELARLQTLEQNANLARQHYLSAALMVVDHAEVVGTVKGMAIDKDVLVVVTDTPDA